MGINLALQVKIFFESCIFGMILGFVFDIFKVIKYIFNKNYRINVFFYDVCYFFIISVLTFLFMLTVTHGSIRIYILITEIIGLCIYFMAFSQKIFYFFIYVVKIVRKINKKIKLKFLIPLFVKIKHFYIRITYFIKNHIKKCKKKKKHLENNI